MKNKRKTIAIDIDGTLRNFDKQVDLWLEVDHVDKLEKFRNSSSYYKLDEAFDGNKESVHKWIYEVRPFQLFVQAERLHNNVMGELNFFSIAAEKSGWDVVIASKQHGRAITSTLYWLAKWGCRVKNIQFFDCMEDKLKNGFDAFLDDCPLVLENALKKKKIALKVPYSFNEHINCPPIDIINGHFNDIYEALGIERILEKK